MTDGFVGLADRQARHDIALQLLFQRRHAVEDLGLNFVAVAHRHQAGFALREDVHGIALAVGGGVVGGKISFYSVENLRHLLQEVVVGKFGLAGRLALLVDEVDQFETRHRDFIGGGGAKRKRMSAKKNSGNFLRGGNGLRLIRKLRLRRKSARQLKLCFEHVRSNLRLHPPTGPCSSGVLSSRPASDRRLTIWRMPEREH